MKEIENRKKLAILDLCRSYLFVEGFLTETEALRLHQKILKWKDKNEVKLTRAQLDSANFVYNDNAKEEEGEE